jgi:small conductance mechanosensitive channel
VDLLETFDVSRLVPFLLDLVGAIVLLVVTVVVAGWARRATRRALERSRLDATLTRFGGNLARYGVLVLGGLAILSLFGISVASFAAIIAAAAFAIGLAFQGTLSNFSAGAMLLIFRPFRIGDVVSVAGMTGKVVEIDLFTTQFDTPDNRRIVVPNGEIFGSTIENITFHPTRRVDVDVGTDYDADLRTTRTVLEEVASSTEGVLEEPAPQIYLKELGGSSIDWAIRVWADTADYWAVRERITQRAKEALDAAGIGIPFPQMDVHLDRIGTESSEIAAGG